MSQIVDKVPSELFIRTARRLAYSNTAIGCATMGAMIGSVGALGGFALGRLTHSPNLAAAGAAVLMSYVIAKLPFNDEASNLDETWECIMSLEKDKPSDTTRAVKLDLCEKISNEVAAIQMPIKIGATAVTTVAGAKLLEWIF